MIITYHFDKRSGVLTYKDPITEETIPLSEEQRKKLSEYIRKKYEETKEPVLISLGVYKKIIGVS